MSVFIQACRVAARSTLTASCLRTSSARHSPVFSRQIFRTNRGYTTSALPSLYSFKFLSGLGFALLGGGGSSYLCFANLSSASEPSQEIVKDAHTNCTDIKTSSKEIRPSNKESKTVNKNNKTVKKGAQAASSESKFKPKFEDYQAVYDALAQRLEDFDEYEDGSYGPVVLRLAWHCSGTYDVETGTGGSNGATMRFDPEAEHGANLGLKVARDFLEPIKEKFQWITYSDLWTLAGVCAIQEMQGPIVPWRPGRSDRDASWCTPDGRLPDGSKGQDHLRCIFGRMGFNDQEIVALSGAHALGRCHTERSGFEGPWTFSPTVVTNEFYRLLMEEEWGWREWNGNKQYQDAGSKSLMMLPTDMALIQDSKFLPYVKTYAEDNDKFFEDFSNVVCKLFELGVPFESSAGSRFTFEPKA